MPSPDSSPGRAACNASSGGGAVPTTSGFSAAPVIGLFSGLPRSGSARSICSGVGFGGVGGELSSPFAAVMPVLAHSTAVLSSHARRLRMIDHLDLMMERVDLHRRLGAGLLAE